MRIAAILLAAGSSVRFGPGNKLLSSICGQPMVRRIAFQIAACDVNEIWAVTGPDHADIENALAGLPVHFVHNPNADQGLGASVATGVRAAGEACDGLLIVPADQPALTASFMSEILRQFRLADGARIVHAVDANGRQRNPVLWPRRRFAELIELSGDHGAKSLILNDAFPAIGVTPDDPWSVFDIDTPDALNTYLAAHLET